MGKKPLVVNGESFRYEVETPDQNRGKADLIIFAVKYHHLPQALKDVRKHAGADTIFISVMNGIDSEERIAEAFGKKHVLHTVALGMDAVRVENRINYTTPGKLLFGRGELPDGSAQETDPDVQTLARLCDEVGLKYENPHDILRRVWSKFMLNIGVNQVSAILESPYGAFQRDGYAQQLMRQAMGEAVLVAEALRIELHQKDIEELIGVLKTLSPMGKTSMYQDIAAGRKTEVEMFAGKLLELAEQHGLELPVNRVLFALIKAKEESSL